MLNISTVHIIKNYPELQLFQLDDSDRVIYKCSDLYHTIKDKKNDTITTFKTKDGFQSGNILHDYSDNDIMLSIVDSMEQKLNAQYNIECNHVCLHMLDYASMSEVLWHNHKGTEDMSYILYLNDTLDGHTLFQFTNKECINIVPKKGLLAVFPSHLQHCGERSVQAKRILVGALRYKV